MNCCRQKLSEFDLDLSFRGGEEKGGAAKLPSAQSKPYENCR